MQNKSTLRSTNYETRTLGLKPLQRNTDLQERRKPSKLKNLKMCNHKMSHLVLDDEEAIEENLQCISQVDCLEIHTKSPLSLRKVMMQPNSIATLSVGSELCDELHNITIYQSLQVLNGSDIILKNKVQTVNLDDTMSSACTAELLIWYSKNFQLDNLATLKLPKNMLIFCDVLKALLQFLAQCPNLRELTIQGKFFFSEINEDMFDELNLSKLESLELHNDANCQNMSDNIVREILLASFGSPINKMFINFRLKLDVCEYFKHFYKTLVILDLTFDISQNDTFDLTQCFLKMPKLNKLSIHLLKVNCSLETPIVLRFQRSVFPLLKHLQIISTCPIDILSTSKMTKTKSKKGDYFVVDVQMSDIN